MNENDFSHLCKLCRIACTEEELKHLNKNLTKVLGYIKQLDELDTQNVEPCSHVIEIHTDGIRDDVEGETINREKFLENAPSHVGGMIRVPPVIKFNP